MSRFRLACHTIQFEGEDRDNPEKVLREIADAGWDGVEGLFVPNADGLVTLATLASSLGLHLVNIYTLAGRRIGEIDSIRFNLTLGNDAAEVPMLRRRDWGGDHPSDDDITRAAQSLSEVLAFCVAHHIKGFHHAHLGTLIETVEDAERLLAAAPDLWLLLDTGHLVAARSDPMQVFQSERLRRRIGHVHLKDFHADDPTTWNHRTQRLGERGRFAEPGAGNFGLDVGGILQALDSIGYAGWVSVELDHPYPPRPAAEAARVSRQYLRRLGY